MQTFQTILDSTSSKICHSIPTLTVPRFPSFHKVIKSSCQKHYQYIAMSQHPHVKNTIGTLHRHKILMSKTLSVHCIVTKSSCQKHYRYIASSQNPHVKNTIGTLHRHKILMSKTLSVHCIVTKSSCQKYYRYIASSPNSHVKNTKGTLHRILRG